MTKATVSAKGQISIPKAIGERLNLKPGTQVALDVQGERIVMKRLVAWVPGLAHDARDAARSGQPSRRSRERTGRRTGSRRCPTPWSLIRGRSWLLPI